MKVHRPPSGFTLVEILVAVVLLGAVALGVATLYGNFAAGKAAMSAKSDAGSQNHELFTRLQTYFRTRAVTRADGGFTVAAACTGPGPAAPCIEIFRSGKPDASGARVTEKIRVKTACRKLTSAETTMAAKLKLPLPALADAVTPLCNVRCAPGGRPVVLVRRWADFDHAPSVKTDTVFPALNRFNESSPLAAGVCVAQGAQDVRFLVGTVWGRNEGAFALQIDKKDFTAPLREDESKIEFLPP